MKPFNIQFVFTSSLLLLLTACGGGGGGSSATTPTKAAYPTPAEVVAGRANSPVVINDLNNNYTSAPEQPAQNPNLTAAVQATGAATWRNEGFDGKGVKVAVLDTGLSDTSVFSTRLLSNENQRYEYRANQKGYESGLIVKTAETHVIDSGDGIVGIKHGQAMSEIILGPNVGMAPQASLIHGMVSEDGKVNNVSAMSAVGWAIDQGADIINLSFTHGILRGPNTDKSTYSGAYQQLQTVFQKVINQNVLVVNSAGNNNKTTVSASAKANLAADNWRDMVDSKASQHYVIAGALDISTNDLANYATAAGDDAYIQSRFLLAPDEARLETNSTVAGSSVSAALVSGAAALLKQRWSHLGGREIAEILLKTASKDITNYSAEKHGVGKLDLATAYNPVGKLNAASAAGKASIASVGVSLPNINVASASIKHAQTAVFDDYNRDYAVPVSLFIQREADTRFSEQMDNLLGFEYVQRQNQRVSASQINGKQTLLINFGEGKQNQFVFAQASRYAHQTLAPSLNDKHLFDAISQTNQYFAGLRHHYGRSSVGLQKVLLGNEYVGYTHGVLLDTEYRLTSDYRLVTRAAMAQGKMSNQLEGRLQDVELVLQGDDVAVKGYHSRIHYDNSYLIDNFNTEKTGILFSKNFVLAAQQTLNLSIKHEHNGGSFDFVSATRFDGEKGQFITAKQKLDYGDWATSLGLTYQYRHWRIMGLYDMDSVAANSGVIVNYARRF